jgi:tetratricopeptide (TPR) repeat protein
LQENNLRAAEREFQAALKDQPTFHPAETALGYLELARKDAKDAVGRFDRALATTSTYVPALLGRGRALLELGRDGDALASLEAALSADPSLTDLKGRIEVLRVRALQDNLARAKAASDAGRWDEARAAYAQAISASPESAFLYRDLALVNRKANDPIQALEHFRKAVSLDPTDARSWGQIAAILEEQGDAAGALEIYEKTLALDSAEVPVDRLERLREAAALATMPEEYRAIPAAPVATRGDVAAMIGVRLATLLAAAAQRQAVVTDTRGHWAQQWILPVVRSGVMDTQPNYTFQPGGRVRRGDLAQTVSRVLDLIATQKPETAKRWRDARLQIPDVGQAHLSYPAVSEAVASGVMPLAEDGTFQLLRPVTGAEVGDVVARLEALADVP